MIVRRYPVRDRLPRAFSRVISTPNSSSVWRSGLMAELPRRAPTDSPFWPEYTVPVIGVNGESMSGGLPAAP